MNINKFLILLKNMQIDITVYVMKLESFKKNKYFKIIDTIYQWINDKIFFDIPDNENIKKNIIFHLIILLLDLFKKILKEKIIKIFLNCQKVLMYF